MTRKLLFILLTVLLASPAFSQQPIKNQPDWRKLHYLSEDEMHEPVTTGINFTETPPPPGPVRMVAEFEPMQGVLIRYPLGIPISLIAEMAEDVEVVTRVTSQSMADQVLALYAFNGVNTANCSFLITPFNNSDSYWTRDYGPWFVFDGNKEPGVCDFPYNRNRPQDNMVPVYIADMLDINLFGMNLTHTGGNMMVDGLGMAASTDLLYEENTNMTQDQIHQKALDYLGITRYDVTIDPLDDYIKHIDCWGKYLAPDKILIGRVPITDYRFAMFESVANYFATTPSSYGYPYKVYRVFTPGTSPNTPYTNSLILNNKVLVPLTGSQHDTQAISVYQEAMPGYEIIGIQSNDWYNTDALHCRTMGIADIGMLFMDHRPLYGTITYTDSVAVQTTIIPYSGEDLHQDSLIVFYRVNGGDYQQTLMSQNEGDNYLAWLTNLSEGDTIDYYLYAADNSNRNIHHPYMGSFDPYQFILGQQEGEPLSIIPDTLYYINELSHTFTMYNVSENDIVINYILTEIDGFAYLPSPPDFPYTLPANDSLVVTVDLNIPVNHVFAGEFLIEYVQITSSTGDYQVVLMINPDLVESVDETTGPLDAKIFPNPSNSSVTFSFSTKTTTSVSVDLYDLNGRHLVNLLNNSQSEGLISFEYDFTDNSGRALAEGVYVYRITTPGSMISGKLIRFNP